MTQALALHLTICVSVVISIVDVMAYANLMQENEYRHHMIQIGLSIPQYAPL
uniref:Uncharacterized protein n=1 Tax=Arundo donax TaxID=35708 RepID=A0A0A9HLT7_ARUDO